MPWLVYEIPTYFWRPADDDIVQALDILEGVDMPVSVKTGEHGHAKVVIDEWDVIADDDTCVAWRRFTDDEEAAGEIDSRRASRDEVPDVVWAAFILLAAYRASFHPGGELYKPGLLASMRAHMAPLFPESEEITRLHA